MSYINLDSNGDLLHIKRYIVKHGTADQDQPTLDFIYKSPDVYLKKKSLNCANPDHLPPLGLGILLRLPLAPRAFARAHAVEHDVIPG